MNTPSVTLAFCLITALGGSVTYADSFGSGLDVFEIEFVEIENPGNAADTTGDPNPAGAVSYSYRIGKYEVTEGMVDKANSLGGLGLMHGQYGDSKPAAGLSWFKVAELVNWLNVSTGYVPAYKFDTSGDFQLWASSDAGYNPNNLYRNSLAKYFLPSTDEWYKAAYYDPTANVYYDYPTGSNDRPDGIDFAGDPDFDAVFFDGDSNLLPNDFNDVGLLSPYGTGGQGGSVLEWEETSMDLLNNSVSAIRGNRGGWWGSHHSELIAEFRNGFFPDDIFGGTGFRVASISVPEPATSLLVLMASTMLLSRRTRRD